MADQPKKIKAWAAMDYGAPLVEWEYEAPALKPNEVGVEVRACGICLSDVDLLRAKHGAALTKMIGYTCPMVAGHEGVGIVREVGSLVHHLKVGDVVGLGVGRGCCRECMNCLEGKNNLCAKKEMMFKEGAKGAFSEFMRIKADWAIKIPDGIPIDKAGPLMCAGTTTFAPFRTCDIRPGDAVGVLGIGGLGHLSLQFARAFGCEVYALSRGTSKEAEARTLGAHHFVNTDDADRMNAITGKLNYLMVTAGSSNLDFGVLMKTLAANGTLVLMGIIGHEVKVSVMELIMGQKKVTGIAAGSTATTYEMLHFAALHKIIPQTEPFPFANINEAIQHVADGKARYRAVLLHK
jgi:uncharacterized zinc-type alcohol dehydrogenase-like protein